MARERSKKYPGVYLNRLKNGDISYSITFKDEEGVKQWRTIGKRSQGINEHIANRHRNEIVLKIQSGEAIAVNPRKKKKYRFTDAFEDYIEWAKYNKKTWKQNDVPNFQKHIAASLGQREMTSLKPADFEVLKNKKLEEGLAPKTVEHILATARQIINYAIKNDKVKGYVNPISQGRVKMPRSDNLKLGFFRKEQIELLLKELEKLPSKRMYHLTVLLVGTGARFSEIASLTWQDVDFENGKIYFKPTKNGNMRYIAISKIVERSLRELHEKRTSLLVIPSTKGTVMEAMPRQWQKIVDRLFPGNKTAGKYRLTVHSLRHTHASWMAMEGMDILHIKEQLGHKTLQMTLRYSHLIPNQRHDMTKKIFDDL